MPEPTDLIEMTPEIVSAYVAKNSIRPDDVPAFIASTHTAIIALSAPSAPEAPLEGTPEFRPAVSVRKSLASPDFIVSMIDGKPYKTLRRHLSTNGMTPAEYRTRYGLKADYPMVAPTYSETRRGLAHRIGLGRKALAQQAAPAPEAAPALESAPEAKAEAPAKRGRGRPKAAISGTEALKKVRGKKAAAEPVEA